MASIALSGTLDTTCKQLLQPSYQGWKSHSQTDTPVSVWVRGYPNRAPPLKLKMATADGDAVKTVSELAVSEVRGDLFSCSNAASMAHCVSADLHMGRGVATAFKKKFGRVEELRAQGIVHYYKSYKLPLQ